MEGEEEEVEQMEDEEEEVTSKQKWRDLVEEES